MEGLTKCQTVWIHSYAVGHGNNIKIKQSVHTDKEKAVEAWRLLGGAFNEAVIVGQGINETPATDAFMAEVRAQGVDVARNAMIDFVEGEVGPNENVPGLIRSAEICVSIATNLRKGVQ